jgi:hypothetical protein
LRPNKIFVVVVVHSASKMKILVTGILDEGKVRWGVFMVLPCADPAMFFARARFTPASATGSFSLGSAPSSFCSS